MQVVAGSPSQANVSIISLKMSLFEDSPNYVIGRVLAIHSGVDDLGTGKSRMSRTMGDSGPIVTCALIKVPLRAQLFQHKLVFNIQVYKKPESYTSVDSQKDVKCVLVEFRL